MGEYNVHDPSCKKTREYYYAYSTDASYGNPIPGMEGKWEIICLKKSAYKRGAKAGQILWGENRLASEEVCSSSIYDFESNKSIANSVHGTWELHSGKTLSLQINSLQLQELIIHRGYDWENVRETILFSGIDSNGCSVWGKKLVNE